MFELRVSLHFSAAHKINGHAGKCQFLHGHNWNVNVIVQSSDLNHIGLAVDFSDVKSALKEILDPLDHSYLNEHPAFLGGEKNPTAENVSKYIFDEMKGRLRGLAPQARLVRIDVFETDTCSARYFES